MPAAWVSSAIRLGLLLAAGLFIGWLYDRPVVGLLIACAAALAWQLMYLLRLYRWLHGEKSFLLPDGSGIWAQVFARINFVRNRSRRRSKRLRTLLKELRASAKSFPDGGIILNARNEIVIHNRAARELLGLKKQRDSGQRIENLLRHPGFVEYLAAGDYQQAVEIESPVQAGGWLSCHLVPYGPEQRLLLVRDITKQRVAEEMRKDFVANASHELRTPLTVVSGYLDVLADDAELNEDLREPVQEMQRQTRRMQNLVHDLLTLSEIESAKKEFAEGPVDMAPILETARQEAHASEGCPATVEVSVNGDFDIRGNEDQLQSVVSNLVSNAVRATLPEGEIHISWLADARGGCIEVSDTGCGIAREHINRLSERFYRVETGRNLLKGGGTGLGLAIVKHALLQHDAELEIESELGKGSVFRCRFPAARLLSSAEKVRVSQGAPADKLVN